MTGAADWGRAASYLPIIGRFTRRYQQPEVSPFAPQRLVVEQQRIVDRLGRTLGLDDSRTALTRVGLGSAVRATGDLPQALRLQAQALSRLRTTLGDRHFDTLTATSELGITMLAAGHLVEAERLLRFTYEKLSQRRRYESETAAAAANLALALRAMGRLSEARALLNEAVVTLRDALGEEDPATLACEMALASLRGAAGEHSAAREAMQRVTDVRTRQLGDDDRQTLAARASLGAAYRSSGLLDEARRTLQEVYDTLAQSEGPNHPSTLGVAADLAATLGASSDPAMAAEGIELARNVVEVRSDLFGSSHPQTLHAMRVLSSAASGYDDDLALAIGGEVASVSAQTLGVEHIDTLRANEDLAATLERVGEKERAVDLRRMNVELRGWQEGIAGDSQPPVENLAGALTSPDEFVEGDFTQFPTVAAPAPVSDDLVTRTAHMELVPDREIRPGDRFEVVVFIDCAIPETDQGEGRIVVRPPPGVGSLELDVWLVVSRHFTVEDTPTRMLDLDLSASGSPQLRFRVRVAHARDQFPESPEIRALFSYRGWPSGLVRLAVPLEAPEVERLS
jgi:tetratricopeptide (TPR) repeat protein